MTPAAVCGMEREGTGLQGCRNDLAPVATSWSRSTSQSRPDLGMRSPGSAQQAPKERDPALPTGQSHAPTAPAVPPTAVQHLRGSLGRGTSPAAPQGGNQAPSSSQDRQGRHRQARGHREVVPCVSLPVGCLCHPGSPNPVSPSLLPHSCIAPAACSVPVPKPSAIFAPDF